MRVDDFVEILQCLPSDSEVTKLHIVIELGDHETDTFAMCLASKPIATEPKPTDIG